MSFSQQRLLSPSLASPCPAVSQFDQVTMVYSMFSRSGYMERHEARHAQGCLTLITAAGLRTAIAVFHLVCKHSLPGERNDHVVADAGWNSMWNRCKTWTSRWWLRCLCQVILDDCSDEVDLKLSWMMLMVDDPGVLYRCSRNQQKMYQQNFYCWIAMRYASMFWSKRTAVGTALVRPYCYRDRDGQRSGEQTGSRMSSKRLLEMIRATNSTSRSGSTASA